MWNTFGGLRVKFTVDGVNSTASQNLLHDIEDSQVRLCAPSLVLPCHHIFTFAEAKCRAWLPVSLRCWQPNTTSSFATFDFVSQSQASSQCTHIIVASKTPETLSPPFDRFSVTVQAVDSFGLPVAGVPIWPYLPKRYNRISSQFEIGMFAVRNLPLSFCL